MIAATIAKKASANAAAAWRSNDWAGGRKKYQAVNADKKVNKTVGQRPAKKAARIIAGKKVMNGRPGGSQSSRA